ncbi:MAG: hypothetical protein Q8K86_08950 [Candidatus Nanopelagicaceae bacterium]|nr:hypothetical protein [Candidatus Nanopelagicaceae bacterium]
MPDEIAIDLAQYKSIREWRPKVGDVVIWHGWFTHWFGVVSGVDADESLRVTKAGLPLLMLTMTQAEMKKNSIKVDLRKVGRTKGEYAVIQKIKGASLWYV